MAVDQLPGQVWEFAGYLNKLMTKLDQRGGWCAVFWQRDPDGMRACLDGTEVPPWDVVQALLQDVATAYGPAAAAQETDRAHPLHQASIAAYDSRPGGRDALGDRLDIMLREQRYAAERTAELTRRLSSAATQEEAEALNLDLAWAHDDHDRATARCAELRTRIENLDRRAPHLPVRGATSFPADAAGEVFRVPDRRDTSDTSDPATPEPLAAPEAEAPDPAPETPAPAKQRPKRRPRGGARFAGATDEDDTPAAPAPETEPAPAPAAPKRRTLRGARFAGVAEKPEPAAAPQERQPRREALDEEARREVTATVEDLLRLRREGRSGEAHALLVEIAHWPAARYPLLAAALHRAGLGADWATLLWEAASLPADKLVAAADALTVAGRTTDGEQMLRQGVARPADEIGAAVLELAAEGRDRQARALLDAYVRVRTPEEAARSVEARPGRLVPLLLAAARGVSDDRYRDMVHALRVAGFTT
ncbi:hypothetical protein SGFS_030620 [Streptomyces graminofaciens]|uniref:UL36 very large tegument protein n=1 Tax=Streptomyces graminofaciens TaxID=68212 RepID=A0ABM7F788_9ACTN|nr:hypothetical protein [Streptomyces graminofaciens]BBC31768.1 hypothetical protein SGFS_030620 [Streptomyces graminofaciens]